MSSREVMGPEGEMRLRYETEESGSSHRDVNRKAILRTPDDAEMIVVLTLETYEGNASKHTSEKHKKEFSIPVDKLIALIKEHGEEYHHRPFAKKKSK